MASKKLEDFGVEALHIADPDFTAPDLVGAVEGWRSWRVYGEVPKWGQAPKLYSVSHGEYFWKPRQESVAECARGCAKANVPGESCRCVPLDTEILTRRGWLSHDEVRVGDLTLGINPVTRQTEWTPVLRVVHNEPQQVLRVGNDYWSARATADHYWPIWTPEGGQYMVATADLSRVNGRTPKRAPDEIVTRVPYAGGHGLLTPQEAAILGWLHTDADLASQRIFQKKPAQVAMLHRLLIGVPHTTGVDRDGMTWWRLRTPYFRSLWTKAELDRRSLLSLVMDLSRPALEAFMEAVDQADGTTSPSGQKWITQNIDSPSFDAINLGMYLLGYRPRVRVHDPPTGFRPGRGMGRRLTYASAPIRGQRIQAESLGHEPTWCVTTGLGTWTMRQDEHILPTHNCGFYSAKTREHLMGMSYHVYDGERDGWYCVIGVVANWGKVIPASQGWRSQKSYPVRLYVPFEIWKLAKPLREAYGVQVELNNFLKPARVKPV